MCANYLKATRAAVQMKWVCLRGTPTLFLHAHTRSDPEGGGYSSEHGDDDIDDFTPKVLVFHDSFDL